MFVLTVGYVDMTTYPLTKYYHRDISPWNYYTVESVYFIYRLFILFISTLSLLLILYTVSWKYKRDYLHAGIDILFYVMFCIINTMKKRWHFLLQIFFFFRKKSFYAKQRFYPEKKPLMRKTFFQKKRISVKSISHLRNIF